MQRDVPQRSATSHWQLESPKVHQIRIDEIPLAVLSLPVEPPLWPACLTPTEIEIVRRLVRGESRESIARGRAVSSNTVAAQIHTILNKLGVESASALVAGIASLEQ
jgi:DNA-binding NarL/FixJ family response regulator